ncbi:MAG: carboxypeptidase-like regulatory domain-containing protein [Candidatus Diapherotrites archaeon]
MALDALKDKWVAFSDWLEEKGIPVPLFFLLILLLIVGGIYFIAPDLFGFIIPPGDGKLTVTVTDNETVKSPINGATVLVEENGVKIDEKTTNANGQAEFTVTIGKQVKVTATYGDVTGNQDVKIIETTTARIALKIEPEITTFSKVIRFVGSDNSTITKKITFSAFCQGNSEFKSDSLQTTEGEYSLEGIPSDCGKLNVAVSDVEDVSDFEGGSFSAAVSDGPEKIEVKVTEKIEYGTAVVFVEKTDGTELDPSKRCDAELTAVEGGEDIGPQQVEASGSAQFENVLPGTYTASVNCHGYYKAVPSDVEKEVKAKAKVNFSLEVEDTTPFTIKFLIFEKDNKTKKLEGITLELKEKVSPNKSVGSPCTTGKDGTCQITVPENKPYNLYAKKGLNAANLSGSSPQTVSPKETAYEFSYDPAQEIKPSALIVTVKEDAASKAPVEGVKIELFYAIGESIDQTANIEGFTGADGVKEFQSVPAGEYYVKASLAGLISNKSTSFKILEEQAAPEKKEILLKIAKGNFAFTVINASRQPMPGATIKAINIADTATVGTAASGSDGTAKISIMTIQRPFFVVELPGYMPFVTGIFKPVDGVTKNIEAVMLEETQKLEVKFGGLYKEDATVQDSAESGQVYTAKLLVVVPNKGYSTAGIHFRAGQDDEGQENSVDGDIVAIGNIESAAQSTVRGLAYSPPGGAGSDMVRLAGAGEPAKWANIEWTLGQKGMPAFGVFSATAEVLIDELATEGDMAKISYRGWGAKGSVDRDPLDSVLGSSASAAGKQGLYAKTYDVVYSVGEVNLCLEGYCRIVSITDLSTKSKTSVFDKANANMSSAYRLNFTINRQAAGATKNAKIMISNKEKGLKFRDYSIKDALGGTTPGTANGFEFSADIGTFDQYKTVSGWVEFDTVKSGVSNLVISIESDKGSEMQQIIAVTVVPGKPMKVEFVPKEVVPMIDNLLVFRVFEEGTTEETEDEEAPQAATIGVPEASVSVTLDGTQIGSGFTDSEGAFPLEIEAPKAGSKLKVSAKKPGYKPIDKEILIDEKIVTLMPAKIQLDMMADSGRSGTIKFSIENGTAITLKVSALSLSKELSPYLRIQSPEEVVGKELAPGESLAAELEVELTQQGINTTKQVSLDGALSVEVESAEFARKWSSDLGIAFRILLGGETDQKDCISIEPAEWKFSTYGADKKISIDIRNDCTVNGKDVALRALEASVSWPEESLAGEFRLSSDSFGEEEKTDIALGEAFTKITDSIPAGFEGTMTLTFKPSAETKSAESEPEILFRASHVSEKGTEKIKAKVNVSLLVNRLAECLAIVVEGDEIELRTAPYNQGWGIVQDYFSTDPYAETTSTTGQSTYPNSQYQPFWGSSYGYSPWSTQTSQWQPQGEEAEGDTGTFTLENSCKETVLVDLSVRAGLDIEEQTFEIEPGASTEAVLAPTSKIGKFDVKVRAKLESETSAYKEIGIVKVKVMRAEEIAEKCKPTVEPTYFRATFLGWQKSAGRIINKCVDLGYRLSTLTKERFHCYKPDSGGTDNTGTCPLISGVWSGTPVVQKVSDTENIEVLEFGIQYNPNISEQMSIPLEGPLEQRVGQLRVVFSKLVNSIISPGIISIPMTDPNGQAKYIPREVTFEDPFEWIGVVGMLMNSGDPNKQPDECIFNKNYFVLPSWGAEWAELKDSHFTENQFLWKEKVPKREMVMPYALTNDEAAEQQYCGSTDKIQSVKPTVFEDGESGVKLSFNITNGGHHVVMTVDRGEMATKCAVIDTIITLTVKRAFYNTEATEVTMPVQLTVLNRGVAAYSAGCENQMQEARPIPDWASNTPCTSQETGTATFKELGFDRLKFNWRAGEIAADACDPLLSGTTTANTDYIFCDATQFSLALSSKFNEIRGMVDALSLQLQDDPQLREIAATIAQDGDLVNEINGTSGKLYRLYKKQLKVHDNVSGKDYLLFLGENDGGVYVLAPELMASPVGCDKAKLLSDLKGWIENLSTATEESTSKSLSLIPSSFNKALTKCYGKDTDTASVVAIIPASIDSLMESSEAGAKDIWSGLKGAIFEFEESSGSSYLDSDSYVMSFGEYGKMHTDLITAWRGAQGTGEENPTLQVQIGNATIPATQAAWIEFLNNLNASAEFSIGIRNKKGLSENRENFVRENSANAIDKDLEKLAGTEISAARLIKDNYSETFVNDFTAFYKDMAFSAEQIKFELYDSYSEEEGFEGVNKLMPALPDTGEYYYRAEPVVTVEFAEDSYSVVLDKIDAKLALKTPLRNLSETEGVFYDFNPFFSLPFDGEVGQGNISADYGVGFNTDVTGKIFFSNESQGKWFAAVNRMPGIITLTPAYSEKYDKTRSGAVLSINLKKGTFNYTPSYPAAISAEWDESKNNTIYYRLAPGNYSDIGKMKELFVWWPGEEGSEEGRSDSFQEFEGDSFCEGWSESIRAGKVLFSSVSPWKSVVFMPANASNFQFELLCAKQPTIITAKPFEGDASSTSKTTTQSGGTVALTDPKGRVAAIQDYIDRIESTEVCVNKGTKDARGALAVLDLHWNVSIPDLTDTFISPAAEETG